MIKVTLSVTYWSFSCPTEGVHAAGEGSVRLHRRRRRRARLLCRWHHRGVGSIWRVVVEREAAGEKWAVSCQLHNIAVRNPQGDALTAAAHIHRLPLQVHWYEFLNITLTHLICAPHVHHDAGAQRTVSQLVFSGNNHILTAQRSRDPPTGTTRGMFYHSYPDMSDSSYLFTKCSLVDLLMTRLLSNSFCSCYPFSHILYHKKFCMTNSVDFSRMLNTDV